MPSALGALRPPTQASIAAVQPAATVLSGPHSAAAITSTPGPDPDDAELPFKDDPFLRREYELVSAAFAASAPAEAYARVEAGKAACRVARSAAHGSRGVALLAEALRIDDETLRSWGRVADTWCDEELAELFGRRGRRGFMLRISHLVELACIADSHVRVVMTARTFDEQLSVRALKLVIKSEVGTLARMSKPDLQQLAKVSSEAVPFLNSTSSAAVDAGSKIADVTSDHANQAAAGTAQHFPPVPRLSAFAQDHTVPVDVSQVSAAEIKAAPLGFEEILKEVKKANELVVNALRSAPTFENRHLVSVYQEKVCELSTKIGRTARDVGVACEPLMKTAELRFYADVEASAERAIKTSNSPE